MKQLQQREKLFFYKEKEIKPGNVRQYDIFNSKFTGPSRFRGGILMLAGALAVMLKLLM